MEEKICFQKCYLYLLANYSFRVQARMNFLYFKACNLLCMSCCSWKLHLFLWDKKSSKATPVYYIYTVRWRPEFMSGLAKMSFIYILSHSRLVCCVKLGSRLSPLWQGKAEYKHGAPLALPVPNPCGRGEHGFGTGFHPCLSAGTDIPFVVFVKICKICKKEGLVFVFGISF